jgi:hypothetical protein
MRRPAPHRSRPFFFPTLERALETPRVHGQAKALVNPRQQGSDAEGRILRPPRRHKGHHRVVELVGAVRSSFPGHQPEYVVPIRNSICQPMSTRHRNIPYSLRNGYTLSMKTAVSIPDGVFEEAERLAHRARRSRSDVYSAALKEYVARHSPDEVTEAMDRVCATIGDQPDTFVSTAARRVFERSEW